MYGEGPSEKKAKYDDINNCIGKPKIWLVFYVTAVLYHNVGIAHIFAT